MFLGCQQANCSLVGVEEAANNVNAYKPVAVAGEVLYIVFMNFVQYFRFVKSEKNKLFFEVLFIEGFAVFALLVRSEGWGHGV